MKRRGVNSEKSDSLYLEIHRLRTAICIKSGSGTTFIISIKYKLNKNIFRIR